MLAIGCAMAGLPAATAFGTTYYVSSSSGSDANGGTSAGAAWATAAKVNAQSLQPGDSVLFKRGDVWNDARNSARQDTEIETTKSRVVHLEQIAATNTEGRIRTEAELQELREGQSEIKVLIQAHARCPVDIRWGRTDRDRGRLSVKLQ